MNDQSKMCDQATFADTPNATSLQALGSGHTPCETPDGATTAPSGLEVALASLSPRQAKEMGLLTSGTCGQSGMNSLNSADQVSCSESRSPQTSSLEQETKLCSMCEERKPLSDFRKWNRSKDGYRGSCKKCLCSKEKDARVKSGKAATYARDFRMKNPVSYIISRSRETAKRKGLEFDLDQHKDALTKRVTVGLCEVTGIKLDLSVPKIRNQKRPHAVSVDRIDSKLGYTMDNVRVVCLAVNLAMNEWGEKAIVPIIQAWARRTV